jgi:hypothetical protein
MATEAAARQSAPEELDQLEYEGDGAGDVYVGQQASLLAAWSQQFAQPRRAQRSGWSVRRAPQPAAAEREARTAEAPELATEEAS